jgi:hypothetical protein
MNFSRLHHVVLGILFLLMPIDAFVPGAALLREFGGRPFNLFLLTVIGVSIASAPASLFDFKWRKDEFYGCLAIFSGFGISTCFFLAAQIFGNPLTGVQRSPFYSFVSQASILLVSIVFIFYLREFFARFGQAALAALPAIVVWASLFHLFFFLIQALAINGLDFGMITGPMNWVRPDAGNARPFGLMSEPSYWGAFVAYTWPILYFCFRNKSARLGGRLLAVVLIGSALLIGARTLIAIVFIQLLIVVFASHISIAVKLSLAIACGVGGLAILVATTDTFAVSENLSSAMRLGSTLLGLNVASAHGLTGVGIGQFHYYFTPEFAPDFLFLSEEAAYVFSGVSDMRASTFNFFVRLVVELGVIGFLGFFWLIVSAGRAVFRLSDMRFRFGLGLAYVGALSFWLTQDSFLYSPALLFMAVGLAVGGMKSSQAAPAASTKSGLMFPVNSLPDRI